MRELDGLTRAPRHLHISRRVAVDGGAVLLLTAGLLVPATRTVTAGFLVWAVIAAVYFAPAITAHQRHAPNEGSVAVVNLFLGWTVIGWIVALAMAMRDPAR